MAKELNSFGEEKTLVFCATDLHADMVKRLLDEAFKALCDDAYNEAEVRKITGQSDKVKQLIHQYKIYAQGVKTNVLFFTKGTTENPNQDENCTQHVWVYDLRTNMPSFGKRTPFTDKHLQPFENCFHAEPREEQHGQITLSLEGEGNNETRWRCISRDWIKTQKADSLDIAWLKDQDGVDAASLPEPDVLAAEATSELTEALRELNGLMQVLGEGDQAQAQNELLAEVLGLGNEVNG